jgi:hypothetical protein
MNKAEEYRTDKENCEVCRADYEGNAPLNCFIYTRTGLCKYLDGQIEYEVEFEKDFMREELKLDGRRYFYEYIGLAESEIVIVTVFNDMNYQIGHAVMNKIPTREDVISIITTGHVLGRSLEGNVQSIW